MAEEYQAWLDRQALSSATRRTYAARVRAYLDWIVESDLDGDPLDDPHARDWAVRDYRRYLLTGRKQAPATVNTTLAALDNLYNHLGLGPADAARQDLPQAAPRALDADEQRRLWRITERDCTPRDRAIVAVLFHAGVRLAECAALDVDDVSVTARRGQVTVRSGKGERYRQIPLNSQARRHLGAWLGERPSDSREPALWLNPQQKRLSGRSIDKMLARVGQTAGIEGLSAHVLRHTCCTNLVRAGVDVVLVAEIAGHRRLDTTRRYSLPTEGDRQAAVESVTVEY